MAQGFARDSPSNSLARLFSARRAGSALRPKTRRQHLSLGASAGAVHDGEAPIPHGVDVERPIGGDGWLLASGHSGMWNYITKDSTLVMIPDANHNVHHDAPGLVNRTIRNWLDARE